MQHLSTYAENNCNLGEGTCFIVTLTLSIFSQFMGSIKKNIQQKTLTFNLHVTLSLPKQHILFSVERRIYIHQKEALAVPNLRFFCNNNLMSNRQAAFCSFLHVTGLFLSGDGPPTLKPDTKEASFSEGLWPKLRLSSSKSVTSESRKIMTNCL